MNRPAALSVAGLRSLTSAVGDLDVEALDDGERIDALRALDELKCAAAATQARLTAAFVESQRAERREPGVSNAQAGRGIAAQVGLALRISPHRARRYVGWAAILTTELPNTLACLTHGQTTEWRAMIVARETAWLSREHRHEIDEQLAPLLPSLGDKRVEGETKTRAYRLDPHGYLDRMRAAESDRHVGVRPAPDAMCRLSGLLPVAQGVAAYAALRAEADSRIAAGDPRGRGQLMADTLVQRVTGQERASDVALEIELVMTDRTLLGEAGTTGHDEPAQLIGYGPVPAAWARDLALDSSAAPRWLRRLYRAPRTGELAALDSRRRLFPPAQRRFVRLRDQVCRTPWCEAPIRHIDHVLPAESDGPTAVSNAQGYCQACNHAKQAPGWATETGADRRIVTTTPTGRRYTSRPPDLPGTAPPPGPSQLCQRLNALVTSGRLSAAA